MKYEEAIKNLESIVTMMESGKLDLDQLEEKLKEAQQLIKLCRDKLTKTDEEISKLLIIILERTTMIGILKALGARNKVVRHTFLWFAAFIIARGLVIGNAIGIGLLALQRFTGIVKLDPTTYYVSEVPVEFSWLLFALINVATLAISIAVLVGPSYLISTIHPAKSMRYE